MVSYQYGSESEHYLQSDVLKQDYPRLFGDSPFRDDMP